jgi:hypothetical protein
MKARDVNRAAENDFSPFEDWQILELYNSMSPRKLTGFMDRRAMERRTQDLLDVRGLMLYHQNNGGAQYQVAGIWIYRAEAHPTNVYALGYVHRDSNRIIRLLIDHNPKSGASRDRFAFYRDGMTVYEYRVACRDLQGGDAWGKSESDIDHDVKKGFIRIEINADQELADHARETILQR